MRGKGKIYLGTQYLGRYQVPMQGPVSATSIIGASESKSESESESRAGFDYHVRVRLRRSLARSSFDPHAQLELEFGRRVRNSNDRS